MKTVPMESVITHWHCDDPECKGYGEDIDWPVSYLPNNGEPICCHCDCDMVLSDIVSIEE